MEFGPRALGARSILGDARSPKMQSVMNLKIKFRESFRPFAPSVLEENAADYFELQPGTQSPYMLLVAGVQESRRKPHSENGQLRGIDKLREIHGTLLDTSGRDAVRIETPGGVMSIARDRIVLLKQDVLPGGRKRKGP
jgi:carbamoyltransferase